MKHKQVTLSEQILALSNPTPVDGPSDYWDENTTAKVAEFDEGDEEDTKNPSVLRRKTAHQSIEEDGRYTGHKTSRQQWSSSGQETRQGENVNIDEEDDEQDGDEDEEEEEDDEGDDEEEDDEGDDEEDDDDDDEDDELMTKRIREMTRKLKGKRENVSMDADDESLDDYNDEDDNDDEYDEEDDDDEEDEDQGIEGFSQINASEEIEKGKAVQSQLGLWDSFMESRIKLQKALHLSNQLPQCQTLDRFLEDGEEDGDLPIILKKSEKELTRLMQSLISLQDTLLEQNPETQHIIHGETPGNQSMNANEDDNDEKIPSDTDDDEPKTASPVVQRKSQKRKLDPSDFDEHLAKHHKNFESFRNSTVQKWYEKTRLSTGKMNKKSFSGFERSALVQIQQILQDKNRLVQRTQLKRSEYTILGQRSRLAKGEEESHDGEKQDIPETANQHLKNHDPEIFDDDDFYHQLLRELIERRTSSTTDPIQLTRQWLQVQKLRTKVKRQVDTKASKGRKLRYDVHQKLVSFMAPEDTSTMLHEARMELFKSIFGQSLTEEETAR